MKKIVFFEGSLPLGRYEKIVFFEGSLPLGGYEKDLPVPGRSLFGSLS